MSLRGILTTPVYEDYWGFAAERQAIFFRKLAGTSWPWTTDAVLQRHRFTNTYRACDRVSQYLIRNVIYRGDDDPQEVFFRIVLFKMFNRSETWELLLRELGDVSWKGFSFTRYASVLSEAKRRGVAIYSAAYIMPSGSGPLWDHEKHKSHLRLIQMMMCDDMPKRIADSSSMKEVFSLLSRYPSIGPFLAYQLATDLNYSELTEHSEMEFGVPGPGARSGIRKCFRERGGMSEADVIRYVAERQADEFQTRGLKFQTLWGRPLQLIDCQNLFCEVDKYARVAHPEVAGLGGRTRIKRNYVVNPQPLELWFPPKWGINDKMTAPLGAVQRRLSHVS